MGRCLFMRKGSVHTAPVQRLPSGYTELAYIQSSGTQYIDTGFKPNQDTRLACKMICVPKSTTVYALGARTSNVSNMFGFIGSNNVCYSTQYGTKSTLLPSSLNSSDPIVVDKNKNVTQINGETVLTQSASTFSAPVNLTLFAMNNNGTINKGSISIYYCQIYDNGTLIRDFIPCINASGEVGLYDFVGKQFYGNAGTGVFTGSEVA